MEEISVQATNTINDFISNISSKEDLNPKTVKEYQGDLKHFANWFENIDAIPEWHNIFTLCANW